MRRGPSTIAAVSRTTSSPSPRRCALQNDLDLLFVTRTPEPIEPVNLIRDIHDPAMKRAGLRRSTFHSLRHSFVTYRAAAGVPLAKVGDWVGHSDCRVTEIYRHASADSESSRSAC
ncbi:MAG: tyrosine-type recombinase/integrase [Gaiellales bacterium]